MPENRPERLKGEREEKKVRWASTSNTHVHCIDATTSTKKGQQERHNHTNTCVL